MDRTHKEIQLWRGLLLNFHLPAGEKRSYSYRPVNREQFLGKYEEFGQHLPKLERIQGLYQDLQVPRKEKIFVGTENTVDKASFCTNCRSVGVPTFPRGQAFVLIYSKKEKEVKLDEHP